MELNRRICRVRWIGHSDIAVRRLVCACRIDYRFTYANNYRRLSHLHIHRKRKHHILMAHFAELLDGVVQRVIVVHDNDEANGAQFCHDLLGGEWLQCSYNNRIRKQFPSAGFTYDDVADQFVAPQPYASWTLDENNDWQPPTPKPDDNYSWNEDTQTWQPFEQS